MSEQSTQPTGAETPRTLLDERLLEHLRQRAVNLRSMDPEAAAVYEVLSDEIARLTERNRALEAALRNIVHEYTHDSGRCAECMNPASGCDCTLQEARALTDTEAPDA